MMHNDDKDINNYISTLSEKELDVEFDNSYGTENGQPFTTWTTWFVYFPICYDGSEWCGSIPRNPQESPSSHQGG